MLVELDIFSGRPNPRWELDEQASGELQRLEASLEPATRPAAELPGLGYRGFRYGEEGNIRLAFLGTLSVGNRLLADPSMAIERFLLAALPPEFSAIRPSIAAALE